MWRIKTHCFRSPYRPDLRPFCTANTPAKDLLDIWPAFPILVNGHALERIDKTSNLVSDDPDVDNIVAALKRSDRVCQIMIACTSSQMEEVWTAMRESFTELTDLWLKRGMRWYPSFPIHSWVDCPWIFLIPGTVTGLST